MADLGLELGLAISAVKEEDGKQNKDGGKGKDGKSKDGKSKSKERARRKKKLPKASKKGPARRDGEPPVVSFASSDEDDDNEDSPLPPAHASRPAAAQAAQAASAPPSALDYYFRKPAEALLRIAQTSSGTDHEAEPWTDREGFLMAAEFDSETETEDDSSAADPGADPEGSARRRIRRESSSRRREDLLYVSITGNVPASQLSIATVVPREELQLLGSGQNYGVVIATDASTGRKLNKKSKLKGKRRGKGFFDVAIVRHEFKGKSAEAREEEDDEDNSDGEGGLAPSASMLLRAGDAAAARANGEAPPRSDGRALWPPPPVLDNPEPPSEKPPRLLSQNRKGSSARHSGLLVRAAGSLTASPASELLRKGSLPPSSTSFGASADSLPVFSEASLEVAEDALVAPPRAGDRRVSTAIPETAALRIGKQAMRKAPLQKQISAARAGISKGMTALGIFRPGALRTGTTVAAKPGEERFLMAADVPYVIPAPPPPQVPPADGSDELQQQQDFELLRMFVEDLRATALKLDERKAIKTEKMTRLQEEIERADDEFARLLNPNSPRPSSAQVTSVTSNVESLAGQRFRVENIRR